MITREKIGGIIGTAIFAVLLFVILLFSVFTLSTPSEELEGIPVMFGGMEDAYGEFEPPMDDPEPAPASSPETPPFSPQEPLITQTNDPTIDVEVQREEERRKEQLAAEQKAREEAERRKREEEARKREINRQMSGLFSESSDSRGNTEGQGTQGVSTGNASQGSPSGTGGIGSYNLGGRSLGRGGLVEPRYNVNDYGKIIIEITVDPAGNVIDAVIGKGTNVPNSTLINEALKAAKSTKFNAINSANNQIGTITYNFSLK